MASKKTTQKQIAAAKKNIKKASAKWKSMTKRQHSLAQPQGRSRAKPGTTGRGRFYRIEIRPKGEFKSFRIQDVGKKGGLERLAGRRSSGSWDTVTWLIDKKDSHVSGGKLIVTGEKARSVLKQISGHITHLKGDVFKAKPRRNIPESEKPTLAQRRAEKANIKKAQAVRKK